MARKREAVAKENKSDEGQASNPGSKITPSSENCSAAPTKNAPNSSMPVYSSIKDQLAQLGLALREIPGDGNCLFGALADQMDGSRDTHIEHRQQIVEYIRDHRCHFEPFIEDGVTFQSHLRRLSELGTFGGNECIVAFARLHNVIVVIHQLNTPLWTICGDESNDKSTASPNTEVHISYHNGDHYNSVRRKGDYSYSPAKVCLILRTSNSKKELKGELMDDRHEIVNLLMQYTGCTDPSVARRYLEDCNYDLELATEELIRAENNEESNGENVGEAAPLSASATTPQLWSEGGTGLRLFGQGVATRAVKDSSAKSNVTNKIQDKLKNDNISNRQRKELKKQLKKHKNTERKKCRSEEDFSDSDASSVPAIHCLRI